jgi:hypothetical protein
MNEKTEGEFDVHQKHRDAGIGYLELMRQCNSMPTERPTARTRVMSARSDWATKTVQVTITPL